MALAALLAAGCGPSGGEAQAPPILPADEERLARLLADLQGGDLPHAWRAEDGLRELGPSAASGVRQMHFSPSAQARAAACRLAFGFGDQAAVPGLIGLLDDESAIVRREANLALCGLTGKDFGFRAEARPEDRAAAKSRWEVWSLTGRGPFPAPAAGVAAAVPRPVPAIRPPPAPRPVPPPAGRPARKRLELRPRFSGRLEFKEFTYVHEHPEVEANDVKRGLAHLEAALPLGEQLIFASGQAVADYATEDSEEDAELVEAYADLHLGDWDARLGQQVFSWGSGILFNPTDNVGRWRARDPFDPQRRGVPAAMVRYNYGLTSIEGIYLPAFGRTTLPKVGERFFIYSPDTVANPAFPALGPPELTVNYVKDDYSDEPDGFLDTEQYAARLRTSWGNWDLALSYFNGYENIALITAVPLNVNPAGGAVDMAARYVFPRERVYGADLAGTVGKLGLHIEAAYFDMRDTGENVGVGDKDYTAYVAGVEYPFEDIISSHDLSLSLEYAGEAKSEEDDRIYINRIYQNSLLLRSAYAVDYKLSFELQEHFNLENKGTRTRLGADYRWSDHACCTAAAEVFSGPKDTFFGAYDDNDRLILGFRISF